VTISQRTSQKFSPASRARLFAQALLNRPIAKGESVDLESMVGRRGRLSVVTNNNGYSAVEDVEPAPAGADSDAVTF
jgi:hypothetical protein